MATASSVQREPSMEEILASIRRIIEDSDGGRNQPGEAIDSFPEEMPGLSGEAMAEMAATEVPEVDAFRAELRTDDAGSEPTKPVSLAELQAQLASGQATPARGGAESSGDPAPARRVTLAEVGARVTAAEVADIAAETAAATGHRQETFATPETAAARGAGFELPGEEPQIEIDDEDLVIDDEQAFAPSAGNALRPALVSEQTSRQVAAAFGELSEAFASRSKKSFDEMAEEMLRPMLQDWLDNNLPTLVERLVREEIERVARGAA